jgi:hypothetical protein
MNSAPSIRAGHDAADEQLGDRNFGGDAVDDHDDRRGNQQAERAGAGQGADRDVFRVTALGQFRQGDLADGGAGGRRRARDGGENGAADDIGVKQTAGQLFQPGREALEHVFGEPGAEQDLAHPEEHRQCGQGP